MMFVATMTLSLYMLLCVGRRMRLAYFASPYELLDVNRPGQDRHFTREGNNNNLQTDININMNCLSNQESFFACSCGVG